MKYVISDLHGYPHERFLQLLEKAGFNEEDTLYILGDAIDCTGDGGIETVRWISKQPNVVYIRGEHECGFSEYLKEEALTDEYVKNGGYVTLRSLEELSKNSRYAAKQVIKEVFDAATAVNIGLSIDGKCFFLYHGCVGRRYITIEDVLREVLCKNAPDSELWSALDIENDLDECERFFAPPTVVFGHTPTALLGCEYAGKIIRTNQWIDIDTGVCLGYEPVLLRLDDMTEFRHENAECNGKY